jgi:hypothetical protein
MAATQVARTNIGTNDDGSGTTGTVLNTTYFGLLYDNIDALFSAAGLRLNQGTSTADHLALESSSVAHGMTSVTTTDAYGVLRRTATSDGGLNIIGLTEVTEAIRLSGCSVTDDTTKSGSAIAPIVIVGFKKSGTSVAGVGANANLMVITNAGGANTRFIFDAEGDMHYDGAAPANYDRWDDVALLRTLDQTFRGPDLVESEWDAFVHYCREDLERAGIVSPGGFVNLTKHTRLMNGALWQQHCRIRSLETRLLALEAA